MRNIELMSHRTSRCIFLPFRVDEMWLWWWLWWCRCCCLPMNEWMNVGGWLVICPQVISCSIIATYEWTEMTSSCYESHAEWMVHVCCSLVCIRWVGASCARDECVDGGFVTLYFFRVDVEHLWQWVDVEMWTWVPVRSCCWFSWARNVCVYLTWEHVFSVSFDYYY